MIHDAAILLPASKCTLVTSWCIISITRYELLAATTGKHMMIEHLRESKGKSTVSTLIQCRVQMLIISNAKRWHYLLRWLSSALSHGVLKDERSV